MLACINRVYVLASSSLARPPTTACIIRGLRFVDFSVAATNVFQVREHLSVTFTLTSDLGSSSKYPPLSFINLSVFKCNAM